MTRLTSNFAVEQKVYIDEYDDTIVGVVTAVMWRGNGRVLYEVGWIHNGIPYSPWLEEFRLRRVA